MGENVSMTKQDIINQVCENADLPRSKAEEAVETVIGLIKNALGEGRVGNFASVWHLSS